MKSDGSGKECRGIRGESSGLGGTQLTANPPRCLLWPQGRTPLSSVSVMQLVCVFGCKLKVGGSSPPRDGEGC